MTKTLTDEVSVPRLSFLKLPEQILADANSGCLIVDQHYKVIAVNIAYQLFHNIFCSSNIVSGKYLQESSFTAYPESFQIHFSKIFSGDSKKISFDIDSPEKQNSQYKISIIRLSWEENNVQGACVVIKKRGTPASVEDFIENEDLFKLLIDNSTAVYQLADAAMVYTYSSEAITNILHFTPAEVLGKNVLELTHPDDREQVKDWLIELRRQPGKLLICEYRIKNKQGEYIWIENSARNMLNNEKINSVVINFRNIQAKKIADHALVQAEQRLSLLLNNTEESFIILNSRLRIITYNKAAQDRSPYFYRQELQSGLSVLDLIPKEEIDEYIFLFEEVFKGTEIERETKFIDDQDELHIYNHTFRPLFDQQKDIFGVFITSTNITERKKLTEEVALHSERLKTAQKIAKLGYLEYNLVSKAIFFSDQFYKILQITDIFKDWQELLRIEEKVHADDRDSLKKEIEKSFLSCKDFNLEFRYIVEGGTEKVISAIGGTEKSDKDIPVKFRVTLQDITDSKMALLAIQTLESKFKSLFDHSIDGIVLSKINGDIISANPSICQMLGYTLAEITSLNRADILDMNSPSVSQMLEQRRETGEFVGELNFKHRNGNIVPVEITSILITDAHNNPYLSTIIRDITEKKKIESEQNALTEELIKNNQDLQQFSFITSHNLRAPVANLLSLLSLYNKENHADEFNQLLVEKFEEATFQLNQTLNDLVNVLVIKSKNNIEKETISFSYVYTQIKKNLENLISHQKGTISADFSEVDEICYNRIHIESIFLNMISNSVKYSSPDRRIDIKLKSYRLENWVVVDFTDNGLGMDLSRYGDRLFGLYQRFHGHKEGKGLGLYMTKSQVTAMGGKIEVKSQPGAGTTFSVFFKA